jgi:hypothetical protein
MKKIILLSALILMLGCEKSINEQSLCTSTQININNEITGVVTVLTPIETGNIVDVSATVYNFINVGAVSLTINYDSKHLQYTGFIQTSIPVDFYHSTGVIRVGWFSMDGIDLPEGTELFRMNFIHIGKSAKITFDDSYPVWCEYAGGPPDFTPYCDVPYNIYYINAEIQ